MDFISPAFAQAAASPAAGSDLFSSLIPFILILPIMYFLVLRPHLRVGRNSYDICIR